MLIGARLLRADAPARAYWQAVPTATARPSGNLLLNPGMEQDANGDGRPDIWRTHTAVTRASAVRHSGAYAMRHRSTSNQTYVISQVVSGIAPSERFTFSGWTNIPATSDTFTYQLELLWRNASNATLRTDVVRTYTAATAGWVRASNSYTAPANTTNLVVRMNVMGLNATIYADDMSVVRATPPTATATRTASATAMATEEPVATATRTATATEPPVTPATSTATRTATATDEPTATATSTATRTATATVAPSATSTATSTPVGNSAPAAPVITEPFVDGKVVNPGDVHMETGFLSDPDAGDTHRCTDWEIWNAAQTERVWFTSCIGGVERMHTHLGDGVYQGSHAGRTALLPETNYVLRARHRDSSNAANDWSAYATRSFRTGTVSVGDPNQKWALRQPGYELEVVASNFQMPVNIAFKPDAGSNPGDPFYYVTELYGTIKVVKRDGSVGDYATGLLNYNPSGNFPGSGEQGLTGIAVDPATGDVFAAMLYRAASGTNYPKVVRFTSANGGLTAATQTTILDMFGEGQGQSHQVSNVSIGPDGKLYVHNGDGFDSTTGQNLASFRGKILRMNLDGSPATDNPFYNAADGISARDYVYAYGFRNPFGGAWRQVDGALYETENGPSRDRLVKVVRGTNYGYNGTDASMNTGALYAWTSTASVNLAFIQPETFGGSLFPAQKQDHLFESESGCTYCAGPGTKRISEFELNADGSRKSGPTTLLDYTGTGRATVVGLAAGPDGLYFTDFYKDTGATATERGAQVYRIRYVGVVDFSATPTSATSAPLTVQFTDLSTVPAATAWQWEFGDGATSTQQNPSHTYMAPGAYSVRLTVTGASGHRSTVKSSFVTIGVAQPGLNAQYWNNMDFTGTSVTRVDSTIDYSWGTGTPDPAIAADTFSARWSGYVTPAHSQTYTFYAYADDGVRVWVNGQLVVDSWIDSPPVERSGTIALAAGQRYAIRVEYFENGGGAVMQLSWSSASQAKQIVPASALSR